MTLLPVDFRKNELIIIIIIVMVFHDSSMLRVEYGGRVPHVILNNLHRSKLDANRDIGEAAVGDINAGILVHCLGTGHYCNY